VQLVDSSGVSYKESSSTRVTVDDDAIIDDLRKAVKQENPQIPTTIGPAQLLVYKTREDLDNKRPLEVDFTISGIGQAKDTALFVVVPNDSPQGISIFLTA